MYAKRWLLLRNVASSITVLLLLLGCTNRHPENNGQSRIVIKCDEYQAVILPDFGGNCIDLTYLPENIALLRSPGSIDDLRASPLLYGMPLLFFPNRISGGQFTFNGREYRWPLNEPERNNHIHGELYQTPFRIIEQTPASVEMEFSATSEQPYLMFPHAFTLRLRYTVDANGLHQRVSVVNQSDQDTPFGLAFHTTFNLPFVPGGKTSDIRLSLPVDNEYPRNEATLIPTGERLMEFPDRDRLRIGTLQPNQHTLSRFFSRDDGAMRLTDTATGWTMAYSADTDYRFWMLWNGGRDDLLTVEPQTCLIDAFNVERPDAEKGIMVIKPDSTIQLHATINVNNAALL